VPAHVRRTAGRSRFPAPAGSHDPAASRGRLAPHASCIAFASCTSFVSDCFASPKSIRVFSR
jgi:hypothetical protein